VQHEELITNIELFFQAQYLLKIPPNDVVGDLKNNT